MYRTIIKIKPEVIGEKYEYIREAIESAFCNRIGNLYNVSEKPYEFIYQGNGEKDFACIDIGIFTLKKSENALSCIDYWSWIDEESECADVLEAFSKYGNTI